MRKALALFGLLLGCPAPTPLPGDFVTLKGGPYSSMNARYETLCAIDAVDQMTCFWPGHDPLNPISGLPFQSWELSNWICGIDQESHLQAFELKDGLDHALTPPQGSFVDVAIMEYVGLSLDANGELSFWGSPAASQPSPTGLYTQVEGRGRLCGISIAGDLDCWPRGYDEMGTWYENDHYPGPFKTVSVGGRAECALTLDGSPQCWFAPNPEDSTYVSAIITNLPDRQFEDIRVAYGDFACGKNADSTYTCWGGGYAGDHGALDIPEEPYQEVALGEAFGCGLTPEGEIHCWGLGYTTTR